MEGRPRDQRHHGRRGPAAASVPRHPRPRTTPTRAARCIRSQQRADGTWATFHGGPGDLSATVEAYVALRLAGDPRRRAAHARRPPRGSGHRGGVAATRVFTRIWLALFGWWKWDDLPELPPEIICFRTWFPLNIYDFGCWARQTIVPLTVVVGAAPVRPRRSRSTSCTPTARRPNRGRADRAGTASSSGWTRPCTRYARRPLRPLRRARAAHAPRAGSSSGRRTTAAGAASSRRPSTR